MTHALRRETPLILWPLAALWDLLAFLLRAAGRLAALGLGLALMAMGLLLTLTILGAPLGIPLAILGALLLVRALF